MFILATELLKHVAEKYSLVNDKQKDRYIILSRKADKHMNENIESGSESD